MIFFFSEVSPSRILHYTRIIIILIVVYYIMRVLLLYGTNRRPYVRVSVRYPELAHTRDTPPPPPPAQPTRRRPHNSRADRSKK